MNSKKFAIAYFLYTFFSFVVYLIASNTIPAWIIYMFVMLPFYVVCIAYVVFVALAKRRHKIRLRKSLLSLVFLFQCLMVFSSPASCYGWKQGQSCYSLFQTLIVNIFTDKNLRSFERNVPHWSLVELAFPIMVGLYILAMIVFLRTINTTTPCHK